MTELEPFTYAPKKWNLSGLHGISDETLQIHFGLYEGYVKNTNLLNEQIVTLRAGGQKPGAEPAFAELKRRYGFEYNGMRLHELYFDNLTSRHMEIERGGKLLAAIEESFGNFETWRAEFAAVGGMRGVGWAILYEDSYTGQLSNHWITLHEEGNVATFNPILVMDVWEHAFIRDFKPSERGKYVEAFMAHIDWNMCESRLRDARPERLRGTGLNA